MAHAADDAATVTSARHPPAARLPPHPPLAVSTPRKAERQRRHAELTSVDAMYRTEIERERRGKRPRKRRRPRVGERDGKKKRETRRKRERGICFFLLLPGFLSMSLAGAVFTGAR